jgi:hypothetical protein
MGKDDCVLDFCEESAGCRAALHFYAAPRRRTIHPNG